MLGTKKAGFFGGIQLGGHKLYGELGRTRSVALPAEMVYPLGQHIGASARPAVAVGDYVQRGDLLASPQGVVSAAIHASTSGQISAIEERPIPHASGLSAPCIVLQADGQDRTRTEPLWALPGNWREHPREDLVEIIRQAGIVGLGGAAFPAAVKLNPGDTARVDTLILNGAECEPYISCDGAAMTEDADAIARGAELLAHLTGARQVFIGIEDHNSAALKAMRDACRELNPRQLKAIAVPSIYPQGGEKQLIQTLTGKQVPSEGLPIDIGIVVHNVATAAAVWAAVTRGEALTERIVTITGSGVREPANLRVRIGTPIRHLIDACGGYSETPVTRLLMGGPMMGFVLRDDSLPIIKGSNCILVGTADDLAPDEPAMPCIRCGDCVKVCPAGLLPQQLYWHARAREFEKTQKLNLFDCIECGCCAQVCPSNIPLVQYYRFAKTEISLAEQERRKADQARVRFEFREQRLEQEKREKEEARRRKREALAAKQAARKAAAAKAEGEDLGTDEPAATTGNSPAVAAALAKAEARVAEEAGKAKEGDE